MTRYLPCADHHGRCTDRADDGRRRGDHALLCCRRGQRLRELPHRLGADVAPVRHRPFVVLLHQDRPDQAQPRRRIREYPDDVRPPLDRLVQPLELSRGDQPYELDQATLGRDFHEDFGAELTAVALVAVAPLAARRNTRASTGARTEGRHRQACCPASQIRRDRAWTARALATVVRQCPSDPG